MSASPTGSGSAPACDTRLRAGRVFTGHEVVAPGVLDIAAGRVVGVSGEPHGAAAQEVDLGDVTLAPGLVDVHTHGGAGAEFANDPVTAAAHHLRHGTTSAVASFVTMPVASLAERVAALVPHVAARTIAGVHLEGPWIAEEFHGAHPVDLLCDPDPADVAHIVEAGEGIVRMVTIAVERPGAMDAVRFLADRGVVAAIGHTAATFDQTRDALVAGVSGVTHLFNAMPGLHHRRPGPILALLQDADAWLEVIADGVHLNPELVRWVFGQAPGRVVLITDALAAAGMPDGHFTSGSLDVDVRDGKALVAGTETIAGSTLVLGDAVRNVIGWGVPWADAVRAATLHPARYLGLDGVGELVPGARADVVALASDWSVRGVWKDGAAVA
ncbi:N-acetylglucosamine-6-phosphate deacetylase [Propioniciclava soli]|uniref:N-acetylglucosamine-6-phosphate deacetylase n=1 Tax=Propioniciclava soli TaxID=2775081 RepID=UPI001E4AB7EE|nr:N-acetylglucosamine-6-phosphate deacetylase [Propioniciclava soli]